MSRQYFLACRHVKNKCSSVSGATAQKVHLSFSLLPMRNKKVFVVRILITSLYWKDTYFIAVTLLFTNSTERGSKDLTRARVAVSATFAMVGGGQNDPPLTRKLGKLEGREIRRSTALSEPVRSHFGHFFRAGEYWGQQRSSKVKFSKNDGFIRNAGHYLGNYNSYAKSKKSKR